MEIAGKAAIVTGPATETGSVLSIRLGAEGAVVVVANVDPVGRAETVRQIEAAGGRAAFVRTMSAWTQT
jgi:NAD(P)-dependent dehydrogenase (short-subunit alcohol dehydrogenase family)